jgi:hypothetical protein
LRRRADSQPEADPPGLHLYGGEPPRKEFACLEHRSKACPKQMLCSVEATGGFEPPHKGFADLSLTTWVRRRTVELSHSANQAIHNNKSRYENQLPAPESYKPLTRNRDPRTVNSEGRSRENRVNKQKPRHLVGLGVAGPLLQRGSVLN